ncbi:MAG: calcium/sodium antiporter [Rhizobiales bacterium]|nr:calcium/sodium antiporter [Hyphomicrobiales bacterium]
MPMPAHPRPSFQPLRGARAIAEAGGIARDRRALRPNAIGRKPSARRSSEHSMTILLMIGGLALLLVGGDTLVRGAVAIGNRMGLTPLVVGMVIVGFGTSTPELFVSVQASLANSGAIAVGNVIGSNIANVLLILGATAVLAPVARPKQNFKSDGFVLVLVTLLFLGLVLHGRLEQPVALVLIGLLLAFIAWQVVRCMGQPLEDDGEHTGVTLPIPAALAMLAFGFAALWFGSEMLVGASVTLARDFGVSEALIGITIIAIGTSLPELASSMMAAWRGHGNVAYGNIVGSNIFNILGILGAAGATAPVVFPAGIMLLDGPAVLGAALVMLAAMATGRGIGRLEGLAFLGLYVGYVVLRALSDASAAA